MNTGLDLVAMQILLAAGLAPPVEKQDDVWRTGHAIECRIYSERPARNFLPSPGTLATLVFPPTTPHLRVDTGVREGDRITPFYDPMIAKIITHGGDRADAIMRMTQALEGTRIEGLETNLAFLRNVVRHPAFVAGLVRTNFIERHRAELLAPA